MICILFNLFLMFDTFIKKKKTASGAPIDRLILLILFLN